MGTPDEQSTRHKADIARVSAVVSVIAEEEIAVFRNDDRAEFAFCWNGRQELNAAFVTFDSFRHSNCRDHTTVFHGLADDLWLIVVCSRAVDEEYFVSQFDDVAGHADEPLDQTNPISRRSECNDVAALRISKCEHRDVAQRKLEVICQPVDEDDVSLQESRAHRAGRYGIPVGHSGSEERKAKQEDQEALVLF